MKLKFRVAAGFALLCGLFLALVFLQLVVGDRLQDGHARRAERIERALDANRAVLQSMTDAETGVRGFQLTGDRAYLAPYDSGRKDAFTALEELGDVARLPATRRLVEGERQAAAHWLYAYATPIVNGGAADADAARAARGREMFDGLRRANNAVDVALDTEQQTMLAADRRSTRRVELLFAGLAMLVLITGMVVAMLHQRHLLEPLEHIRHTLRRLARGDLSARAEPAGPGEMRTVIGTLNEVAAETERLITAEKARAAAGELRQRVAAELHVLRDPRETGRRIAEIVGTALGAGAVHGRVTVGRDAGLAVTWPRDAPPLPPELAREIRAGEPGVVREMDGGLAVALSGDDACPAGLVYVTRPRRPEWTAAERRLVAALCRDLDHVIGQQRLQLSQARLITELRVLDEQKDVFVSTVTHELRTPLTSILGYAEMLADGEGGDVPPVTRRGLAAILRNAHRLEATVADLLLLDRSGERVGAEAVPVDLAAVLEGLHGELAAAARAKDVGGVLDAAPAWVRGDGVQLGRALRKLVENAIKFTPAGGRYEVRLTADAQRATVTVTDTGMGIPADDLPGLFTPFHRAANAMEHAVQGPGLGLAIVRNIVTEHGGTVSAQSELGRGSTFTVTLPTVPAVEPAHR
jgi:signal transduction histidine kinase/CHASE3 domain sensor protein